MTFGEHPHLETQLPALMQRFDDHLKKWLPEDSETPHKLHKAMRYSALSGGKRIRPLLIYATAIATNQPLHEVDGIACATELIHVYSLIHDDLPCMDNDDLRRGKATCHIEYGEATATLAGDALQALAFRILSTDDCMTSDATARLKIIEILSTSAGSTGMAGGQAIDLDSVGTKINITQLEQMHNLKTGALINACVMMVIANNPDIKESVSDALDTYSQCIGLSFQITDDILDITTDTETLGKPAGSDIENNKPTFPGIIGLEASRKNALDLHSKAIASLSLIGSQATLLSEIADYIVKRTY